MQQPAIDVLDSNRLMTIATVRSDGWPQATIVGYANEGWSLYFLIYRQSQKFANISHDNRVAVAIGSGPTEITQAKAVYAGCEVFEVTELAERNRAWGLLAQKHPNLMELPPPQAADVATMVARCRHVSMLDYTQDLGHTEAITLS